MNQVNSLILEGHLVADPVFSEPLAGFKKSSFTIGVNRFYQNKERKNEKEVSYFDIEMYGENCKRFFENNPQKGDKIRTAGYLKQDNWKKDGKTFSKVYMVCNYFDLSKRKLSKSQTKKEPEIER